MRTYIGINKCSRCGGGSGCYVCNELEPETKNMNEITSEDVAEWMKFQLAKIHENNNYGHVSVEINNHKGYDAKVRFSVYCSPTIKCNNKPTIEDCFAIINSITPANEAILKRLAAAKLLTEADRLEGKL